MGKARNRERLIETLRTDIRGLDSQLKRINHKLSVCCQERQELRAMCDELATHIKNQNCEACQLDIIACTECVHGQCLIGWLKMKSTNES